MGLEVGPRSKRSGSTARFRRCFAGVSQVFRRSFTDSRKQIHVFRGCFAGVSRDSRCETCFADSRRCFADSRRFAGVSRVFRGFTKEDITCFAAVSQQSRIVSLSSRPVALRSFLCMTACVSRVRRNSPMEKQLRLALERSLVCV